MKHLPLLTTLALLAAPVAAQDELGDFLEATAAETVPADAAAPTEPKIYSPKELKEAGGELPKVTAGPKDTDGLAQLHARGVQGTVGVKFVIQIDGSITDVTLSQSSGSAELDAVGLAVVSDFVASPGKDASGKYVPVVTTMPMGLWKDSLASGQLSEKTCADFVIDADWHLATYPDQTISDMRVWKMMRGAVIMTHPDGFAFKTPKGQDVYDNCKAKPKATFYKTFIKDS